MVVIYSKRTEIRPTDKSVLGPIRPLDNCQSSNRNVCKWYINQKCTCFYIMNAVEENHAVSEKSTLFRRFGLKGYQNRTTYVQSQNSNVRHELLWFQSVVVILRLHNVQSSMIEIHQTQKTM